MGLGLVWYAKYGTAIIGESITSIVTNSTFWEQMTTASPVYGVDFAGKIKDVEISGGDRDVSAIPLLGYNQQIQQDRPTVVEVKLTLVYHDADASGKWLAGTALTQNPTGYVRYQFGERAATSTTAGGQVERTSKAIVVRLYNPGKNSAAATAGVQVDCFLNYAYVTDRGLKLDAEGHLEEVVTFKGLASNYYEEDNVTNETW